MKMLLVVAMGLMGCNVSADPTAACDDFVQVMCERVGTCNPVAGDPKAGASACREGAYKALQCSKVKKVADTYGRCRSDMAAVTCARVEEAIAANTGILPSTCTGVFQ